MHSLTDLVRQNAVPEPKPPSRAIEPLRAAVAGWQRYLDDPDDLGHLAVALDLVHGLLSAAVRLDAEGDGTLLLLIDELVDVCRTVSEELGAPIAVEEEAQ